MIRLENDILRQVIGLRHDLHRAPEVSGDEKNTAQCIRSFLASFEPDHIEENIGGYGLLAEFRGKTAGPTVMFRCELDGLPLEEKNNIPYISTHPGKAHLCGHDGHMAMVAGLAPLLHNERTESGRVVLLFQPAEEEGKGAHRVLIDPKFKSFAPDHIFAIHNLPGFPAGELVLADKHFAAASAGIKIVLTGITSHAAEPEQGKNPAMALARLIMGAQDLLRARNNFHDFTLITPIHAVLGSLAYGTSPGKASLHFTLRSYRDSDMKNLKKEMEWLAYSIADQEQLDVAINYEEEFPATVNHPEDVKKVRKVAEGTGLEMQDLREPFRWSEDFGHFLEKYHGALIGLGSGKDQPALHNPDFDFPDEIIPHGITIMHGLYDQILNK